MDENLLVIPLRGNTAGETPFTKLNTSGFIRAENAQHEWFLAITEAYRASHLPFDEKVRDYLATMMWRFGDRRELLEQLEAFNYYQYIIGSVPVASELAQDIADMCLQYVAFFPELSSRRHEMRSLEYVANLGESLYHALARNARSKDDWVSIAYQSICVVYPRCDGAPLNRAEVRAPAEGRGGTISQ